MRVDVITLFPQVFEVLGQLGVTRRAFDQGHVELLCWNPRDYARDAYRSVDDRPYGGGPGMVMKMQPLRDVIRAAKEVNDGPVVFFSPKGRPLTQQRVVELAGAERLVLLCGRYEGIDQRVIDCFVDEEISLGDYVLSGGELPAMVLLEAIARRLPGVLGGAGSAESESFENGLLEYPQYTRPEEIDGLRVPAVLTSGDHEAIDRWRLQQSLGETWLKRRDLLAERPLSDEEQQLLQDYIQQRMHSSTPGDGRCHDTD